MEYIDYVEETRDLLKVFNITTQEFAEHVAMFPKPLSLDRLKHRYNCAVHLCAKSQVKLALEFGENSKEYIEAVNNERFAFNELINK